MMAKVELFEYQVKYAIVYDQMTGKKIVLNRAVSIQHLKHKGKVISEETIGRCVYVRVMSEFGFVDAAYPLYYDLEGNLIEAHDDPDVSYKHYSRAMDECLKHQETMQFVPDLIRWLHDHGETEEVLRL